MPYLTYLLTKGVQRIFFKYFKEDTFHEEAYIQSSPIQSNPIQWTDKKNVYSVNVHALD